MITSAAKNGESFANSERFDLFLWPSVFAAHEQNLQQKNN